MVNLALVAHSDLYTEHFWLEHLVARVGKFIAGAFAPSLTHPQRVEAIALGRKALGALVEHLDKLRQMPAASLAVAFPGGDPCRYFDRVESDALIALDAFVRAEREAGLLGAREGACRPFVRACALPPSAPRSGLRRLGVGS